MLGLRCRHVRDGGKPDRMACSVCWPITRCGESGPRGKPGNSSACTARRRLLSTPGRPNRPVPERSPDPLGCWLHPTVSAVPRPNSRGAMPRGNLCTRPARVPRFSWLAKAGNLPGASHDAPSDRQHERRAPLLVAVGEQHLKGGATASAGARIPGEPTTAWNISIGEMAKPCSRSRAANGSGAGRRKKAVPRTAPGQG